MSTSCHVLTGCLYDSVISSDFMFWSLTLVPVLGLNLKPTIYLDQAQIAPRLANRLGHTFLVLNPDDLPAKFPAKGLPPPLSLPEMIPGSKSFNNHKPEIIFINSSWTAWNCKSLVTCCYTYCNRQIQESLSELHALWMSVLSMDKGPFLRNFTINVCGVSSEIRSRSTESGKKTWNKHKQTNKQTNQPTNQQTSKSEVCPPLWLRTWHFRWEPQCAAAHLTHLGQFASAKGADNGNNTIDIKSIDSLIANNIHRLLPSLC